LAIDPRIAARWLSVRHDQSHRRRRNLTIALGVVTAAVAGWALAHSPLLAVRHVALRGAGHTGAARVLAAARVDGRPMLTVDLRGAAHRVDALPWVSDVQLRRRWPATIEIDVAERTPAAQLAQSPGQPAVVDLHGRVLATGAEAAAVLTSARPALPVLQGLPSVATAGATLGPAASGALQFLQAWQQGSEAPRPGTAAFTVTAVNRAPDATTSAVLAPGSLTVLLGSLDASDRTGTSDKVSALRAVLTQLTGGPEIANATIDVRVPDAPVLTEGKKSGSFSTTQRG
jgi:hypothetical protein